MKKRVCLAAVVLCAVSAVKGDIPVEIKNSAFELCDANGAATGWVMPKKHWKVVAGAGSNGSKGLVFEGDDPNSRDWPHQWITVKEGKRYRISANIKADGLTCPKMGRWSGMSIYIEWFDKSGKLTGCNMTYCVNGKTDWIHRENITPVVAPGVAKCRIVPLVIKGGVGRAVIDDISVMEIEEKTVSGVWSSAYRDEQAEGKVTFVAGLNLPPGMSTNGLEAVFSYPGSDGRMKKTDGCISEDEARMETDVSALAYGTNDIVCTLSDGKRVLGSAKLPFARVKELPPRRVRFDSRQRVLVDGKLFFPLGLYCLEIDRENIGLIADSPFNCIMSYKFPTTDADLDLCHQMGLKVLYDVRRKTDSTYDDEIGRSWMKKRIPEIRNHPAILAWYSDDESAPTLIPRLKGRYRLLVELDGDHPVWAVQDKHGKRLRDYLGTFDVFGTDPYPVSRYPIGQVTEAMRSDRSAVYGLKPVWQVPQAFGWGKSRGNSKEAERIPTAAEISNMAWQAIACGANGMVFFRYHQLREKSKKGGVVWWKDIWPALLDAGRELKRFEKVILSDGTPVPAGVPGKMAARSWRTGETCWLLLVNTVTEVLSAELEAPGSGKNLKVEFGPASAVKRTGAGKLAVNLPPLATVMVRIR